MPGKKKKTPSKKSKTTTMKQKQTTKVTVNVGVGRRGASGKAAARSKASSGGGGPFGSGGPSITYSSAPVQVLPPMPSAPAPAPAPAAPPVPAAAPAPSHSSAMVHLGSPMSTARSDWGTQRSAAASLATGRSITMSPVGSIVPPLRFPDAPRTAPVVPAAMSDVRPLRSLTHEPTRVEAERASVRSEPAVTTDAAMGRTPRTTRPSAAMRSPYVPYGEAGAGQRHAQTPAAAPAPAAPPDTATGLTMEQMKKALREKGIGFKSNLRKAQLIETYRAHFGKK